MEISPIRLLTNYALSFIHSKIHKYEVENLCFEKKHKVTFEEFRQKLENMREDENFQWEDDLLDWKFAYENLKYWQKKAKELQNE